MGRYNHKDAASCWPKGEYPATIHASETKASKSSGAPMDVVAYEVYHADQRRIITDYCPLEGKGLFKLRNLAAALGESEAFKRDEFNPANHIGKSVVVELEVEDSAQYGEQNKIAKVKKPEGPPQSPAPNPAATRKPVGTGPKPDDDIPF